MLYICISMRSAHSPTFPSLQLRHNSFSNPSVALRTSQLILQPFHCFTYVTVHSPTLLSLFLHHKLFTYVTWRATQVLSQEHCSNFINMLFRGVPIDNSTSRLQTFTVYSFQYNYQYQNYQYPPLFSHCLITLVPLPDILSLYSYQVTVAGSKLRGSEKTYFANVKILLM